MARRCVGGRYVLGAYFVAREEDMAVLKKTSAEHVAKCVIFLVEGEDGSVGHSCHAL